VGELLETIEAHVRKERQAAQVFTRNPSSQALSLN
jgi:hypothetical protein